MSVVFSFNSRSELSNLYNEPLTSDIKIGGRPLPAKALADLRSVTVDVDLTAPGMFVIELNNWDGAGKPFPWSDDTTQFAPGKKLSISLGYQGQSAAQDVIQGEITSVEPVFRDGPSTLTVRGYDARHRLMRGHNTQSFANMKDSAIAEKVGRAAGIQVKVEDSKVQHDYVLQRNQTDLAFLQDRARRIGFEVAVVDNILHFRRPPIDEQAALSLVLGRDLLELAPRLTSMGQSGGVLVQGWDVKKKKAVVGKAGPGKELAKMAGSTSGPKAAKSAFGMASLTVVDEPVTTKAEADQMAIGRYNTMALHHIVGDGLCYGRSDLAAGTLVDIGGVGEQFGGLYYVTSVKHVWGADKGYRTWFSIQRNAT